MASIIKVDTLQTVAGTHSSNITEIAPACAQVNKIAGPTYGAGHQTVTFDEILNNKNISLNTSNGDITFAVPGIYLITIGWRFGTAGDIWTGVNLYNSTTGILGKSYGTGNVTNDPGPAHFSFMATVTNVSVAYQLRIYRNSGSMAIATPDTEAGRAIVATIVKVG